MVFRLTVFLSVISLSGCSQQPLDTILKNAHPIITQVLSSPEKYEVQIIYVQIDRDKDNVPRFKEYHRHVDSRRYFYPASTVKLPVAVMALEKLLETNIPGLDLHSRMRIDSARAPQTPMIIDSTSENGLPSIGHFIHQIFLVSDNNAHNRLYEFLGQEEIHAGLRKHGLQATRILHRLSAPQFSQVDNRYTNPISFYHADTLIYRQPEQVATEHTDQVTILDQKRGKGYHDANGNLVKQPFDFSWRNFYPLNEQMRVLKAVMFPESVSESAQFCIRPEDYAFLYREMAMLPGESRFPIYDPTEYYDSYAKFFMYGDQNTPIPPYIRIFNKAGWAYGYMTDCAYIVDFKNKVEFMLAATVYVNKDQIFNDEQYEFEEVGKPFLAQLGKAVYQYELNRRRHGPDLSSLQALFPGF